MKYQMWKERVLMTSAIMLLRNWTVRQMMNSSDLDFRIWDLIKLGKYRMGDEEQAGRFSLMDKLIKGYNNVASTQVEWRQLAGIKG